MSYFFEKATEIQWQFCCAQAPGVHQHICTYSKRRFWAEI